MIVWSLITFRTVCALHFALTTLDHQQILRFVTMFYNYFITTVNVIFVLQYSAQDLTTI